MSPGFLSPLHRPHNHSYRYDQCCEPQPDHKYQYDFCRRLHPYGALLQGGYICALSFSPTRYQYDPRSRLHTLSTDRNYPYDFWCRPHPYGPSQAINILTTVLDILTVTFTPTLATLGMFPIPATWSSAYQIPCLIFHYLMSLSEKRRTTPQATYANQSNPWCKPHLTVTDIGTVTIIILIPTQRKVKNKQNIKNFFPTKY